VGYEAYELSSGAEFMQELNGLRKLRVQAKHERADAAMDRYLIAKSAKVGAHLHCPSCGTPFTKSKTVKVFCNRDCAQAFYRQYSHKRKFRFAIEKGKNAGKLLQMTKTELAQLLEETKAIPLHEIFHCVYCGRMGVKRRADQAFCPNDPKCRERFRLLIRERGPRENCSEGLAQQLESASLSL
jgi:predicted nucleic acid-binding Zn ribbon protein